jgi:hypothetical protein
MKTPSGQEGKSLSIGAKTTSSLRVLCVKDLMFLHLQHNINILSRIRRTYCRSLVKAYRQVSLLFSILTRCDIPIQYINKLRRQYEKRIIGPRFSLAWRHPWLIWLLWKPTVWQYDHVAILKVSSCSAENTSFFSFG